MNTRLKTRIGILVIIILSVAGIVGYHYYHLQKHAKLIMSQQILFYADECPHCKLVEEFINKNGLLPKMPMVMKEVTHDRKNGMDYVYIAKNCGILQTEKQDGAVVYRIEVPLLWTGKECVSGDLPIILYLQKQTYFDKGMTKNE